MFKKILIANRGRDRIRLFASAASSTSRRSPFIRGRREALHVSTPITPIRSGRRPRPRVISRSTDSRRRQEERRRRDPSVVTAFSPRTAISRAPASRGCLVHRSVAQVIDEMGDKVKPRDHEGRGHSRRARSETSRLRRGIGQGGDAVAVILYVEGGRGAEEKACAWSAPAGRSVGLSGGALRGQFFFGDARLYLEKYIDRPRHVEVQSSPTATAKSSIFTTASARSSGAIRRSSRMPGAARITRHGATSAGSRFKARAVRYVGAGTLEFLLDRN